MLYLNSGKPQRAQRHRIIHDDVLGFAADYRGPLFHALLCDPPYHLTTITKRFGAADAVPAKFGKDGAFARASKGFMGKDWDGGDIAFQAETWAAFYDLLLPGAFGMAFASTRGYHRMACAIEDAGFVIHPMLCWAQSQGFPKATRIKNDMRFNGHRYGLQALKPSIEPICVFSKTEAECYNLLRDQLNDTNVLLEELWAKTMKPSEIASVAHGVNMILSKALRQQDQISKVNGLSVADVERQLIKHQVSYASTVVNEAGIVPLNVIEHTGPSLQNENASSAAKNLASGTRFDQENIVVENVPMPDANSLCWKTPYEMGIDMSTLAAILQSNSEKEKFDLNMIWLWRLILVDVCDMVNKSTIETAKKMITELAILNYSLRKLTRSSQDIQSEKNLSQELLYVVRDVARIFIGLSTYQKEPKQSARTVLEPIAIFQKPYGKRAVDDITSAGAGTLNIDGGRIPTGDSLGGGGYQTPMPAGWDRPHRHNQAQQGDFEQRLADKVAHAEELGRWPGNLALVHDVDCLPSQCVPHCPVLIMGEQSGERQGGAAQLAFRSGLGYQGGNGTNADERVNYSDRGTASRFFYSTDWQQEIQEQIDAEAPFHYTPKASKDERDRGLEDEIARIVNDGRQTPIDNPYQRGETLRVNTHPTLKPIGLTTWLAKLLLPPVEYGPRRLFIPFAGAASEVIGAAQAGWEYIDGVELSQEYSQIARKRLSYYNDPMRTFRLANAKASSDVEPQPTLFSLEELKTAQEA